MKLFWLSADATANAQTVSTEVSSQVHATISFFDEVKGFFLHNIGSIVSGIVIIIAGFYLARLFRNFLTSVMRRANYDQTVVTFLGQIVYYGFLFLAIISGLSRWGVPSTSFVAIIGGLGLAIGLALQNNMSNFASGLLLLIFKPFRVGDWIMISESSDIVGSVDRIELLYTAIVNKEQRVIFVPNSKMTSSAVINSSFNHTRYIRFDIGISYANDHHEAIAVLKKIAADNPNVLNAEHMEIGITAFGDNAVTISMFPEVENNHVRVTFYKIMSDIKDRFDEKNIGIPYPQRDVHVYFEKPVSPMPVHVTGKVLDDDEPITGI